MQNTDEMDKKNNASQQKSKKTYHHAIKYFFIYKLT